MDALTDEEIQAQLAGEAVKGPRKFRDKPLASLTRGLRDLCGKVTFSTDLLSFADAVLVYVLLEAQPAKEDPAEKLARRKALIAATDDAEEFRARVSLWSDDFTEADSAEVKRLADEIFGQVKKAEVVIDEKKSEAGADGGSGEPSLTTPPSTGTS